VLAQMMGREGKHLRLGRTEWDKAFYGRLDKFKVHPRVLTPAELSDM
jgi:hypothetical protein